MQEWYERLSSVYTVDVARVYVSSAVPRVFYISFVLMLVHEKIRKMARNHIKIKKKDDKYTIKHNGERHTARTINKILILFINKNTL